MARYCLLVLAILGAAACPAAAAEWRVLQSGPFQVYTEDAEDKARIALNELEQLRHVLGTYLGREDMKTVWPVRIIVTKSAKIEIFPEPKLARDAMVASLREVQPVTRERVVEMLFEGSAGKMPDRFERGLISLLSTLEADATHLTLGVPPAKTDRDWARMHMLAVDPRFSGKLRVLLSNLQRGVELEPAMKNAFEMTPAQIEQELDKHMAAGRFETGSPSARAINRQRFWPKEAEQAAVDLLQLDLRVANGRAPESEYAKFPGAENAAVPLFRKGEFEKAAQANPLWAEPWWREAEKEQNPLRKAQLLTKAASLAPRRADYWIALAQAQEASEQFSEAVKSWSAAERATGSEEERQRIRTARAAGEERRVAKLQEEKEAARRKEQAELEALRQKGLESIRLAEARANAGRAPLDPNVKLEEWRENLGYERASGRLTRVDCLGQKARLHIAITAGSVLRLLVPDPAKVAITGGGERSFGCGIQKPARSVTAEYLVKADKQQGTAGEVTTLEFR